MGSRSQARPIGRWFVNAEGAAGPDDLPNALPVGQIAHGPRLNEKIAGYSSFGRTREYAAAAGIGRPLAHQGVPRSAAHDVNDFYAPSDELFQRLEGLGIALCKAFKDQADGCTARRWYGDVMLLAVIAQLGHHISACGKARVAKIYDPAGRRRIERIVHQLVI